MNASFAFGGDLSIGNLLAFSQAMDCAGGGEQAKAEHDDGCCGGNRHELAHQGPACSDKLWDCGSPVRPNGQPFHSQLGPHPERDAACPKRTPNKRIHCGAGNGRKLHGIVGLKESACECRKGGSIGDRKRRKKSAEPERQFFPFGLALKNLMLLISDEFIRARSIINLNDTLAGLAQLGFDLFETDIQGCCLVSKACAIESGSKRRRLYGQAIKVFLQMVALKGHAVQLRIACGAVQ